MKDKRGVEIKLGDWCRNHSIIEYINQVVGVNGELFLLPVFYRFELARYEWMPVPPNWQDDLLKLEVYGEDANRQQTGVASSVEVLHNMPTPTLEWVKETFK